MPPTDPNPDPLETQTHTEVRPIVIDDLGRFADTAGAFWMALENLRSARAPFGALADHLGRALGDAHLATQYGEAYRTMAGTLDAMESCFEQFFEALVAAGNTYKQADGSVAGRMY